MWPATMAGMRYLIFILFNFFLIQFNLIYLFYFNLIEFCEFNVI